ncbi:MAG: hypothetical protein FJ390_05645, partial [Verrucomicrobia bacterium]|nr:hypothetical protein [Verrucomicrobiota bacterium]
MDDFLKDPKKATLYYREESLRAMAAGQKSAARCWRLAADAAKQVIRQAHGTSILAPVRMPFVDHFAQLALSLKKVYDALENSSVKKNSNENFEENIFQKSYSHYQYWMHCLTVSCSHDFKREIQQILEAGRKYSLRFPKVTDYLIQALHAFKMAQHHQAAFSQLRTRQGGASIQENLLIARWAGAACEAAHMANIFVQRKTIEEQNNKSLLEIWEAMTQVAEKALSLRIKAAEESEKAEEEQALKYSLGAFVMNEAVENKIQLMKVAISTNQFEVLESQETSCLFDEVVAERIAIAGSQRSDDAASWLEAAWEADLKRLEAVTQGYHRLASYWEESRDTSRRVADFYSELALGKKNRSFPVSWWSKIKLNHLESQAKKKIPIMFMEEVFFSMPEDYFPN